MPSKHHEAANEYVIHTDAKFFAWASEHRAKEDRIQELEFTIETVTAELQSKEAELELKKAELESTTVTQYVCVLESDAHHRTTAHRVCSNTHHRASRV